eukprot:SAG31_NODE_48616_length_178_cov_64.126582_1_plen_35_part_10
MGLLEVCHQQVHRLLQVGRMETHLLQVGLLEVGLP